MRIALSDTALIHKSSESKRFYPAARCLQNPWYVLMPTWPCPGALFAVATVMEPSQLRWGVLLAVAYSWNASFSRYNLMVTVKLSPSNFRAIDTYAISR